MYHRADLVFYFNWDALIYSVIPRQYLFGTRGWFDLIA
jgi:hypothetical protein